MSERGEKGQETRPGCDPPPALSCGLICWSNICWRSGGAHQQASTWFQCLTAVLRDKMQRTHPPHQLVQPSWGTDLRDTLGMFKSRCQCDVLTAGKSLNLPVASFCLNSTNNSTSYFGRLLKVLNEIMYVKYLQRCLACSETSINI